MKKLQEYLFTSPYPGFGLKLCHLRVGDTFKVLDKFSESSLIQPNRIYKCAKPRGDYGECIRDDGKEVAIALWTRVEQVKTRDQLRLK